MRFSDLVGLQMTIAKLVDSRIQNRLGHALLIRGREGSGGLALALAFAQYLVCDQVSGRKDNRPDATIKSLFESDHDAPPETSETVHKDSCGVCPSCQKSAAFMHPDIHYAYPVIKLEGNEEPISTDAIKNWRSFLQTQPYGSVYDWLQDLQEDKKQGNQVENRQGNITARECLEIIRKLSLKSFEGGYKILIMWMPEYLGKEGNRLLKLIEEPPPDTLFLLVAEDESKILPTLLSRLQTIRLAPLSVSDIEQGLRREFPDQEAAVQSAALMAEGSYREALRLMHQDTGEWIQVTRDWLNAIMRTGSVAQVKWVEEISKTGREQQKQFLRYFGHLLEVSLSMACRGGAALHPADKLQELAEKLAKTISVEQIEAIVEETDRAVYYIERNAQARLVFIALTFKIYRIIRDNAVILVG